MPSREKIGQGLSPNTFVRTPRIAVLAKFRYKLRESLALLVEVGFIVSYEIDSRTDILNVVRAPRRIALADVIEGKCTTHLTTSYR